jgi:hypothetical protein
MRLKHKAVMQNLYEYMYRDVYVYVISVSGKAL